jgi:hypothetical protein
MSFCVGIGFEKKKHGRGRVAVPIGQGGPPTFSLLCFFELNTHRNSPTLHTKDGGSMFFQNVGSIVHINIA